MTAILLQNHTGHLSPLYLYWPSPAGIPFLQQVTPHPSVLSADMLIEKCICVYNDMSASVKTKNDNS